MLRSVLLATAAVAIFAGYPATAAPTGRDQISPIPHLNTAPDPNKGKGHTIATSQGGLSATDPNKGKAHTITNSHGGLSATTACTGHSDGLYCSTNADKKPTTIECLGGKVKSTTVCYPICDGDTGECSADGAPEGLVGNGLQ